MSTWCNFRDPSIYLSIYHDCLYLIWASRLIQSSMSCLHKTFKWYLISRCSPLIEGCVELRDPSPLSVTGSSKDESHGFFSSSLHFLPPSDLSYHCTPAIPTGPQNLHLPPNSYGSNLECINNRLQELKVLADTDLPIRIECLLLNVFSSLNWVKLYSTSQSPRDKL